MENKIIDWENMKNSSIKMELEGLMLHQKTLKEKIIELSKKLESIEKDYFFGNSVLTKRYKGE
jgi:hypothetical protein